jgi:hypothetical protein
VHLLIARTCKIPKAILTTRDRDARVTPMVPKRMGIVWESRTIVSQLFGDMLALCIGPEMVWLEAMPVPHSVVALLIMSVPMYGQMHESLSGISQIFWRCCFNNISMLWSGFRLSYTTGKQRAKVHLSTPKVLSECARYRYWAVSSRRPTLCPSTCQD